ncbi:unnamed protein product [Chrysoparadoxa australica]
MKVYKKTVPDSPFVAIKAKGMLRASPEALQEVLTPGDIEIVRLYNPMIEQGFDLEILSDDSKISWSATSAMWPAKARTFVTFIHRKFLPDGSLVLLQRAVDHPDAPDLPNSVRGEILHGMFLVKPVPGHPKRTDFTMVSHFNPAGGIPQWLINWLAEIKPASFMKSLEKVSQRYDRQIQGKKNPCKGRAFGGDSCSILLGDEVLPPGVIIEEESEEEELQEEEPGEELLDLFLHVLGLGLVSTLVAATTLRGLKKKGVKVEKFSQVFRSRSCPATPLPSPIKAEAVPIALELLRVEPLSPGLKTKVRMQNASGNSGGMLGSKLRVAQVLPHED